MRFSTLAAALCALSAVAVPMAAAANEGLFEAVLKSDHAAVARLLADPKLQAQVPGSVLWIDEAGLLVR